MEGEKSVLSAKVVRVFPLARDSRWINVLDWKNKEVCLIEDASALHPVSRQVVDEELRAHYRVARISRIHSVKNEYRTLYWDVETDLGRATRAGVAADTILWLGPAELLLVDIDTNRFFIEDYTALDAQTRKQLEVLLCLLFSRGAASPGPPGPPWAPPPLPSQGISCTASLDEFSSASGGTPPLRSQAPRAPPRREPPRVRGRRPRIEIVLRFPSPAQRGRGAGGGGSQKLDLPPIPTAIADSDEERREMVRLYAGVARVDITPPVASPTPTGARRRTPGPKASTSPCGRRPWRCAIWRRARRP